MHLEVAWQSFPYDLKTSLRRGLKELSLGGDSTSTLCGHSDNDIEARTLHGTGRSTDELSPRIYFPFRELSTEITSASEHKVLESCNRLCLRMLT